MKRWLRMVGWMVAVLCGLIAGGYWLLQDRFGDLPEGSRRAVLARSAQYADGAFRNPEPIPPVKSRGGFIGAQLRYVFSSREGVTPPGPVPTVKTDLRALDPAEDVVIWLGHSSFFVQFAGRRILIDPVFSAYASPFPLANRAFEGTNLYTPADMPDIDFLLITHDHWDHLDYDTVTALRSKIGKVVCPLGVGAYFAGWGYADADIREGDWFSVPESEDDFAIHVLPARHYSGRGMIRNKTFWAGFALTTPERRLFFSGDSGYGKHFAEIGKRFDGFDLVVLDCGQYDESWRYVHMTPEDAAKAAEDLRARALLPAHAGRFAIAYHAWDDPFRRIAAASRNRPYRLLTPRIGEPVGVSPEAERVFPRWWEDVR